MNKVVSINMFSLLIVAMILFISGCGLEKTQEAMKSESENIANGEIVELTVSAAASLKDALEEIQKKYEAEQQNIKLYFNGYSDFVVEKGL